VSGRKVWAADEILAAADLQDYIQDQVVFVYANASARSSGILSPTEGMVSYLNDTNLLYTFDGSSWVEVAPNVGTAGTYTKVTTDAKGRVSSGTTLSASDVPALDASKVTSGAFDAARIPSLDGSKITTGNFSTSGNVDVSGSVRGTSITVNNGVGGSSVVLSQNGNVAVGGTLGVTSTATFSGNVYAAATYSQTNTGRAMFVASDGLYGIGSSSARFKENVVDAGLDVDAIRQIAVRHFNYKSDFSNDQSLQVGVIAEELVELGLDEFVFFNDDGTADGVAYEKLALAVLSLVKVQADAFDALEARVKKLESK
jgi:hypothetical protein